MAGRTIAIGDIHGCVAALRALIETIRPDSQDTIITLGDYVDRGPDSRSVIEELIDLRSRCELISLKGNHEIMFQTAWDREHYRPLWMRCGGRSTMESYGELEDIPLDHKRFIAECRPYYETEEAIFLHASYEPSLPLAEQTEPILFWQHIDEVTPAPHVSGKRVYCGHTPQRNGEVFSLPHLCCLDTFCFGGQWLTAYETTTGRIWQADKAGRLRQSVASLSRT